MSTRSIAVDRSNPATANRPAGPDRRRPRRFAGGIAAALLLTCLSAPGPAWAQGSAAHPPSGDDMLIATARSNGVERGEVSAIRKADGDWWVSAADLGKLKVEPRAAAARRVAGEDFYSLRALGAVRLEFDEPTLTLVVDFPSATLEGNVIDLSNRPPTLVVSEPGPSLILSYRLATRHTGGNEPAQTSLDNDLNIRIGPAILRQETRLASSGPRRFQRGVTQVIVDDLEKGRRWVAGDLVSSAGAFGSTVTGAGVMVSRLFDLTPDLLRHPAVSLQAATALPAQVELAVDGSPVLRTQVGPGPIRLDNLLLYGGSRSVRLTVTDAAGRREVIEQPFFFTDAVLARGLHEYSYFAGKRSVFGGDGQWRYREGAWQAFHRYGATDHVTIGAGGEGSPDFTNAGAGLTLRSDRLGVASLELLASHDRIAPAHALGWSARYAYAAPSWSVLLGRRQFGSGFRTFTTGTTSPFLRDETRLGFSRQLPLGNLGFEWGRSQTALEDRTTRTLRYSTQLGRNTTLLAELRSTSIDGRRENSAFLFLRVALDGDRWVGSTAQTGKGSRSVDVEAGQLLPPGEGVGWRVGTRSDARAGQEAVSSSMAAQWNLAPASLEFYANAPVSGPGVRYTEVAVSGSVVGVDGFWGMTRHVSDGFALARLGFPQSGVEILVNNQVQGRTDANGNALLPQIGAFGRQDVSVNEKQVGMEFNLRERRKTIVPAFRSGTVVEFGGRRVRAVAGIAWLGTGGNRKPVVARSWLMSSPAGSVTVETASSGDFYLDDLTPGRYTGTLETGGRRYACRMQVPEFQEAVHELEEGLVCE